MCGKPRARNGSGKACFGRKARSKQIGCANVRIGSDEGRARGEKKPSHVTGLMITAYLRSFHEGDASHVEASN